LDDAGTDSSGNGHDLAVASGMTFVPGKFGDALTYAGSVGTKVANNNLFVKPELSSPFSMSCWFNTGSGYDGTLAVWWGISTKLTLAAHLSTLTVTHSVSPENNQSVPWTRDGLWHHVAYVNDAVNGTFYLDGVQVGQVPFVYTGPLDPGVTLSVEKRFASTGIVDDVMFWIGALSAEQVAAIFGRGSAYPDPL
jgi:hypothetical protein